MNNKIDPEAVALERITKQTRERLLGEATDLLDAAVSKLNLARADWGAGREASIAITHAETASLWLKATRE